MRALQQSYSPELQVELDCYSVGAEGRITVPAELCVSPRPTAPPSSMTSSCHGVIMSRCYHITMLSCPSRALHCSCNPYGESLLQLREPTAPPSPVRSMTSSCRDVMPRCPRLTASPSPMTSSWHDVIMSRCHHVTMTSRRRHHATTSCHDARSTTSPSHAPQSQSQNVVGVLPGRTARRVYISGHYDSCSVRQVSSSRPCSCTP